MSKDHVIVGREIYTNLFLEDVSQNIYSDEIRKTESELRELLSKKNKNVSAETIQKLYESFAKFRYSLACYLTGQKNDGDIYNYFKYAPWASNKKIRDLKNRIYEIQKCFDDKLDVIEALKLSNFNIPKALSANEKNIFDVQRNISNCDELLNKRLIELQENKFQKDGWYWLDMLLSSEFAEFNVKNQLLVLAQKLIELSNKLEILNKQKDQLEKLKPLEIYYNDIENEKCCIFKETHPELADKLNDKQIIDIIFKIERWLALLTANEIFFKNMILKSRDKGFLQRLSGKSFDEFFRDENNHLVSFISDTNGCNEKDVEKHKKDAQNSSTGDIYKIHIKNKNYFIKVGDLFLDTLDKKKNAGTGEEKPASEVAVAQEMYRGTATGKIYDEINNKYLNKFEAKQNLVDTGSHGLAMNGFANIFNFGVDVLVDSIQIVSSEGNHILMKEAQGKLFDDLIEKYFFNIGYIQLSDFINPKFDRNKGQLFNLFDLPELKKERLETISKKPPSCSLQNSVIEINILDYIFSNADRNIGNVFVTQDGVIGIDQDISSPTEDKEYHKDFIINYTKNDLPNLIPYATKIQYDKIKMMVTPAGKKLTENTIKMWIKTVDEDTLNSVVKIIIKRIDEMCTHLKSLEGQKRILKTKEEFNKQTALEIAKGSIKFQGKRLETLEKIGVTNVFNGVGAVFFANYNDAPKPKMENGYDKDSLI